MLYKSGTGAQIELTIWAVPKKGVPFNMFLDKMKSLGNKIIEIDNDNKRVKLIQTKEVI